MAKITSHVWSTARGKVAGIVYFSNPYHPIVARQYVVPVNPSTKFQEFSRGNFTEAVALWSNMTDEQRQAWLDYIVPEGLNPTFGKARKAFIRQWTFARDLESKSVADYPTPDVVPPSLFGNPYITVVNVPFGGSAVQTGISLKLVNNALLPQKFAYVASVQLPLARHFWKGPWDVSTWTISPEIPAESDITINITKPGYTEGYRLFVTGRAFSQLSSPNYGLIVGNARYIYSDVLQTGE
jgi:hypothetical protein